MPEHREGALRESAKLGQAANFLDQWIREIEQTNVWGTFFNFYFYFLFVCLLFFVLFCLEVLVLFVCLF